MGYNSAYSKFRIGSDGKWYNIDLQVKDNAVPYRQERMKSLRDGRPICLTCFNGIHPHERRKKGSVAIEDSQDCKVLLLDDEGNQVGQCCCTWSEVFA